MSLPWHIPLEDTPPFREPNRVPQPSLLKHFCSLNLYENPCEELQTGIMCEIGNQNKDPSVIQKLIAAGMTIARLILKDMEPDGCAQLVQSIRQAVYNYSAELEYIYPLALVVEIRGPDIETGGLKGGLGTTTEIVQFENIRLTTDWSWKECGTKDCLYVNYKNLTDLVPDDIIYIDSLTSDKIKLLVTKVGDDSVECKVLVGGVISGKMTVRISRVPRELVFQKGQGDEMDNSSCSSKSEVVFEYIEEQISWAVGQDVDAVLIPNTQNKSDVKTVKELLAEKGPHVITIACIDSMLGFDNIDEILSETDAIYLSRSILGTDLPVEKIFIAQKIIFAKCNAIGKPCICQGVLNEQAPILCVSDLANLIQDGVDVIALELHYDSPLVKHPTYDAVRMAEHCLAASSVICRYAENIIWQPKVYGNIDLMQTSISEPTKALCISAVELSMRSNAVVIICTTTSGRSAKLLCHAKPYCPIVAVTRACHTARQLRFWRGVRALHYFEGAKDSWASEVEARILAALDYCKAKRIVKAGDPYVIVTSTRRGGGYCDCIRLLYASAVNTIIIE